MVELARLSGTKRPTVSRTVQRMFEKQWLDVALADDLVAAALVLSNEGMRMLGAAQAPWKLAQERARARVAALLSAGTRVAT
jgi:methionyl-tRNA synthetase